MLALILTILLECAALFVLGERSLIFYVYWISVTTITNIPANLFMSLVFSGGNLAYYLTVAVIEILVVALEFLLCFAYTRDVKKSFIYSSICNISSFGIGTLILMIL